MSQDSASTPVGSDAPRRTLSLERRLPLLMTGVLALALAATIALTYATLARTARIAASERLTRAAQQFAAAASPGIQRTKDSLRVVAAQSVVHSALLAANATGAPADTTVGAALAAELRRLRTANDTSLPVVLWSAGGVPVAAVGRNAPTPADVRQTTEPEHGVFPISGLEALATSDSPQVGALHASGSRIAYWLGIPVIADGKRIGYVTAKREVQANPQTLRTIRSLSSDQITPYFRDVDRPFWARLNGEIARAPVRSESTAHGVIVARGNERFLSAEQRVEGTPIAMVLEAPLPDVLAAPRRSVLQLAAVSVAILLLGSVALWGLSRRITRPIVALTAAAERLAGGDYGARVNPGRSDEIGRLGASFNRMATQIGASREELELRTAQAQAANQAKSDFLATMSHELRTPLNAIAGYVDLLDMELRGPITDAQRRDLSRIRTSQQHLLGLISSILDLTRIESGQVAYSLEPVALEPFLAGLDTLVGPQATAKALSLRLVRCPRGLAAVADGEKLRQVLLNLISNAIRYTPAGGEIVLACAARGSDEVAITVSDTGVGIAPERHAEIFEPFVQLDRSLTRTAEGVGLGLAISRDLARGMNGDLTVESAPGAGSRFTITLPRAPVDAEGVAMQSSDETPAVGAAPRISR